MTDQIWLALGNIVPRFISSEAPSGLYVSPDLGMKRIWVIDGETKWSVYLDHEFHITPLQPDVDDVAGVHLGPVDIAIDPAGLAQETGRGPLGRLVIERGKIKLAGSG